MKRPIDIIIDTEDKLWYELDNDSASRQGPFDDIVELHEHLEKTISRGNNQGKIRTEDMSKAIRETYYNYHPVPAGRIYYKNGITVYKNKVHYPEQIHRIEGHPLEDITTRENFYSKCIDYVLKLKKREPTEFLFYGRRSKQGIVMDFRIDELITNRIAWCFVIITILPYEQSKVSRQDAWKTKRIEIQEKSPYPSSALEYVLNLINRDKEICEGYSNVLEGEWDGSVVYAHDDSLHVCIENNIIESIGSKNSTGRLTLVDLDA